MIYKKINTGRFILIKKTLALLLMTSVSMMVFSCTTTEMSNYTSEEFIEERNCNTKELIQITTLYEQLDIIDNNVQYSCSEEDSTGYLSFKNADTVLVPGLDGFKIRVTPRKISLKDVLNLKFSHDKFDTGKTIVYTGLTVAGIIAIVAILLIIFPPKISLGLSGSFGK